MLRRSATPVDGNPERHDLFVPDPAAQGRQHLRLHDAEGFENFLTVGFQASHQNRLAERPSGGATLPSHPEGTENKLGLFVQDELPTKADHHSRRPCRFLPDAGRKRRGQHRQPEDVDGTAFSPAIAALYKADSVNVFA